MSEIMRWKRLVILINLKIDPRVIFMQISPAITEKSICQYISANIADCCTIKGSRPMFLRVKRLQ